MQRQPEWIWIDIMAQILIHNVRNLAGQQKKTWKLKKCDAPKIYFLAIWVQLRSYGWGYRYARQLNVPSHAVIHELSTAFNSISVTFFCIYVFKDIFRGRYSMWHLIYVSTLKQKYWSITRCTVTMIVLEVRIKVPFFGIMLKKMRFMMRVADLRWRLLRQCSDNYFPSTSEY